MSNQPFQIKKKVEGILGQGLYSSHSPYSNILLLFLLRPITLALARALSSLYSFALSFHAALSTAWFVRLNMFLSRFDSFRSVDSSAVHHRLLCGLGRLRGVVSCTAFMIASTSSFA